MHRLGQRIRREILPPESFDHLHQSKTSEDTPEARHLQELRKRLENLEGDEIAALYRKEGLEGLWREVGATREELRRLEAEGVMLPGVVQDECDRRNAAAYHRR